jgi:membrane protease YdiL (CAAX protease family)
MPESVRWKHDDDGRRRLDFRFGKRSDFRKIPIAHFTWPSFVVVMIFFLGSHVPWEWPVMFVWVLGSQLWFYYRKHLVAVVVLHAATNLSILFAVVALNDRFRDAAGQPISLWFFI